MGIWSQTRLRTVAWGGAVLSLSALVYWLGRGAIHPSLGGDGGSSSVAVPAGDGAGKSRVFVPPILLTNYYEHQLEHVPPRDALEYMQRRELRYTAPPDPYALAGRAPARSEADVLLMQWLARRRASFLRGTTASTGELAELGPLLRACSFKVETLLNVGRSFNYLEGDESAIPWYSAGLGRVPDEYAGAAPGSAVTIPLLDLLDQTGALWRRRDLRALEGRFTIAARLSPPLSLQARRATFLLAQAHVRQRDFRRALDTMLLLQQAHERAGDLGAVDPTDVLETHWIIGTCHHNLGQFADAIPHFSTVTDAGGKGSRESRTYLIDCLLKTGRVAEANAERAKPHAGAMPPAGGTPGGERVTPPSRAGGN